VRINPPRRIIVAATTASALAPSAPPANQYRAPRWLPWLPRLEAAQPSAHLIGRLSCGIAIEKGSQHRRVGAPHRFPISVVAFKQYFALALGLLGKMAFWMSRDKCIQCADNVGSLGSRECVHLIGAPFGLGLLLHPHLSYALRVNFILPSARFLFGAQLGFGLMTAALVFRSVLRREPWCAKCLNNLGAETLDCSAHDATIGERQYVDWRQFRHLDVHTTA
jgi:hypothetical protein